MLFFLPSKRGFNFAKIRGFKVTDYIRLRRCNPYLRRLGDRAPLPQSATAAVTASMACASSTTGLLRPSAVAQNSHTVSFLVSIQGDDSHRKITIDYQYFTKSMSLPSHSSPRNAAR